MARKFDVVAWLAGTLALSVLFLLLALPFQDFSDANHSMPALPAWIPVSDSAPVRPAAGAQSRGGSIWLGANAARPHTSPRSPFGGAVRSAQKTEAPLRDAMAKAAPHQLQAVPWKPPQQGAGSMPSAPPVPPRDVSGSARPAPAVSTAAQRPPAPAHPSIPAAANSGPAVRQDARGPANARVAGLSPFEWNRPETEPAAERTAEGTGPTGLREQGTGRRASSTSIASRGSGASGASADAKATPLTVASTGGLTKATANESPSAPSSGCYEPYPPIGPTQGCIQFATYDTFLDLIHHNAVYGVTHWGHGILRFSSPREGIAVGFEITSATTRGRCEHVWDPPDGPTDDTCTYYHWISKTPGGRPVTMKQSKFGPQCYNGPSGKEGGGLYFLGGSDVYDYVCDDLPAGKYYCNTATGGWNDPQRTESACSATLGGPMMLSP